MVRKMTVFVKGQPVEFETTLTENQAFEVLQNAVRDQSASSFETDLVAKSRLRGLSEKQWAWVHKLAMERHAPKHNSTPDRGRVVVGNLQPVLAMLQTAAHHIKYPRIVYRGLRLSLAKKPDTVNVTSDERSYDDRTFYGQITPGGSFQSRGPCPQNVLDVLADLAVDPVSKTAAEGKRTGSCCFCSRELSTAASLHVGYGPICAEKYGLPWGETGPTAAERAADAGGGEEPPPPPRGERCERCHSPNVTFSNHCGAKVCDDCDAHQGLARCYCGWSAPEMARESAAERRRIADQINGYDRDDLGESPDW
jgi:hypothetical protein